MLPELWFRFKHLPAAHLTFVRPTWSSCSQLRAKIDMRTWPSSRRVGWIHFTVFLSRAAVHYPRRRPWTALNPGDLGFWAAGTAHAGRVLVVWLCWGGGSLWPKLCREMHRKVLIHTAVTAGLRQCLGASCLRHCNSGFHFHRQISILHLTTPFCLWYHSIAGFCDCVRRLGQAHTHSTGRFTATPGMTRTCLPWRLCCLNCVVAVLCHSYLLLALTNTARVGRPCTILCGWSVELWEGVVVHDHVMLYAEGSLESGVAEAAAPTIGANHSHCRSYVLWGWSRWRFHSCTV